MRADSSKLPHPGTNSSPSPFNRILNIFFELAGSTLEAGAEPVPVAHDILTLQPSYQARGV